MYIFAENNKRFMEDRTTSQNNAILRFMKSGHGITPIEALALCGCFRLSARIYDLREIGHKIKTEMVEINGKRVARYYLENLEEKS